MSAVVLMVKGMSRAICSVGVLPPTKKQMDEEDMKSCMIFRYLPQLRGKIAWRKLGVFPTPVHSVEVVPKGCNKPIKFSSKREDLASDSYGGNKVRTLQHQLAVVEARLETEKLEEVLVLGSGGSNQVVATIVHAARLGIPLPLISAGWFTPDEPDIDNTLNMLSTFSFPVAMKFAWTAPLAIIRGIVDAVRSKSKLVIPPGGNNFVGVLGQVGGALELAEQIAGGEVKDVDGIYLPIGSACTISGLILGVVIARKHGVKAFEAEDFRICGTVVHHGLAGVERTIGLHRSYMGRFMPLSVRHTLENTCAALCGFGCESLLEDALDFLQRHVVIEARADIVGLYGDHSKRSKEVSLAYDVSGKTFAASGKQGPALAKAAARMFEDLQLEANAGKHYLLWQTKTAVQPRGPEDEWRRLLAMDATVLKWANLGKAESSLRPGKVDTVNGSPDDYRQMMRQLAL